MRRTTGERELEGYSQDAGIQSFTPRVVYEAETEEEVALALQEALEAGLSVTARGGGTAIPTQSVGRGAILIQRRERVLSSPSTVVCEPGVVKSELNRALLSEGGWMPVDPSSYASCTIGGMVANNASGARTLKYGSTIDYVEGVRVVVPGDPARRLGAVGVEDALSGDRRVRRVASLIIENQKVIAEETPQVAKNSSGYRLESVLRDGALRLQKLFVGSEGTLGVITEATLRTIPLPRWKMLLVAESSLDGLGGTVDSFRELKPDALELVDKSVYRRTGRWKSVSRYSRSDDQYLIFCELDGTEGDPTRGEEAVAASGAARFDPLVLTSPSEISEAWEARNGTLATAQELREGRRRPVPGVEDLVVPPGRLGDLVRLLTGEFERRGVGYIVYGHAGDANLHARPLLDPAEPGDMATLRELMDDCFEGVWKMGGSITGEHGDGMLRADYVERQYPKTFWIMQEIKDAFDPKGVLNPGVKLPTRRRP